MSSLPNHDRFGWLPRFEPKPPKDNDTEVTYKPDPVCLCGCGRKIEVVELETWEGEPIYDEACYLRIAYQEGFIRRKGA